MSLVVFGDLEVGSIEEGAPTEGWSRVSRANQDAELRELEKLDVKLNDYKRIWNAPGLVGVILTGGIEAPLSAPSHVGVAVGGEMSLDSRLSHLQSCL